MRTNYAYLEKIGGEWLDDFVYMSKQPLIRMGFEIREFNGDDLEGTLTCYPLDLKYDVIIGSVQASLEFFKVCGIETPKYLGYPEELKPYLKRGINESTIGKLLHSNLEYPLFIKPKNDVKLFTGQVIDDKNHLKFIIDYNIGVNNKTELYCSEVLPSIISEYRCFIHEDTLVGVQHYLGDFKVFPTITVIEEMIKTYKNSNCAYTLDIGVMHDGSTFLIEVNDMWAIGSYGMSAKEYVLMCVRRMREIGRQGIGETESLWRKLKSRYNS